MADETTPYGLPLIQPDTDYIRSPSSGNLSGDINTLAQATNGALAQVRSAAADDATVIADQAIQWAVDEGARPRRNSTENMVYAWADKDDRVAMHMDTDGALHLERDPHAPGMQPLTHTTGWVHAIADEAGHVSAGVDCIGRWQVNRGAGAPSAMRTQIACIGDSLTRGYSGGTTWPLADSWPGRIQAARPDLTVTNLGYAGRTTDEIRLLVGALPLYLSPENGSIPTSGSVAVTTGQAIGWSASNTISIAGSLAGVGGVFTRTANDLTFTRAGTGPAVAVPTNARLIPDIEDYSSHTVVLWVGRNDVNQDVTGYHDTVDEHVVSGILDTIEWLAPRAKAIVVVSATNRVDEVAGTTGHDTVLAINAALKAALPHHYLEMRDYLVHQAIYDAGVTPTQADLDNMAADAPPPSIWDTGSHYLPNIAPYVADRIQTRLTVKGLI